jgi:hypothetical protein
MRSCINRKINNPVNNKNKKEPQAYLLTFQVNCLFLRFYYGCTPLHLMQSAAPLGYEQKRQNM